MSWQKDITDKLADTLRFLARGTWIVIGIMVTTGVCYVVGKLVWFSVRYLDRTLFLKPW